MIPLSVTVWGLRILVLAGIVLLSMMVRSSAPALALMLVWGPMGLVYILFSRGALRLPRFLVPVKRIEPRFYRWLGVGLVKRIVTTRMWPMLNGFGPPDKLRAGQEALDRAELTMIGAEVCHGTLFILMFPVALYFLSVGRISEVFWILLFTLVLHGYPVMLQRVNRWRIQQIRGKSHQENLISDRAFGIEATVVPPNTSLQRTRER
jgi:Glycosyl-4,4'-diaponeurosporenoate acyltransferase